MLQAEKHEGNGTKYHDEIEDHDGIFPLNKKYIEVGLDHTNLREITKESFRL